MPFLRVNKLDPFEFRTARRDGVIRKKVHELKHPYEFNKISKLEVLVHPFTLKCDKKSVSAPWVLTY